jgi:arylsulfatase A-like enzyme/Tfp pilus assembly protein PilF
VRRPLLLFLVIAVLAAGCGRGERAASDSNAPIIVISIDTLRADRLPAYGYTGVATPALDGFRSDAILYANAYSHSPLTLPSHVSMLTGQLPADHGVRNNLGYRFDPSKHPPVSVVLKEKGYTTGAAVSSYVLRGATGLAEAFEHYDDAIPVVPGQAAGRLQRPGGETVQAALQWAGSAAARPFFLFVHLFEPHTPYAAPEPYRSRYSEPYDAEVAHADSIVGAFLEQLKQRGIYDRALIVVLSDHGEGLMDHGEAEHGVFLYREAIHVPLLIKLPGSERAGTTRTEPVQLIDLAPTLAKFAGAEFRGAGRSLLDPPGPPREIFSETMYPRIHLGWSELRSLVGEKYHYIQAPAPELYDIESDPTEKKNVLAEQRRVLARMRATLAQHDRPLAAPEQIAPEEAANLKALGYLAAPVATASGPLPDPKDRIGDLAELGAAEGLLRRGDPAGAIRLLEGLVARSPQFADAWSQLARTYEESGLLEKSLETRRRLMSIAPSLAPEIALAVASNYLQLEQAEQAEAHARLALSSNAPAAHLLIGRSRLARRDYAAAESEARAAMADQSYAIPASVLLAQAKVGQGREHLPEALKLLEDARRRIAGGNLQPVPLLEYARGDVLARMNRAAEAEEAFRGEIRLFPHNRQAYAALAVIQLLQKNVGAAQETMEQLVRNNPDDAAVRLAVETFERFGEGGAAARWKARAGGRRNPAVSSSR